MQPRTTGRVSRTRCHRTRIVSRLYWNRLCRASWNQRVEACCWLTAVQFSPVKADCKQNATKTCQALQYAQVKQSWHK